MYLELHWKFILVYGKRERVIFNHFEVFSTLGIANMCVVCVCGEGGLFLMNLGH